MKLNVTLKATTGISSGFIMVVIFTRATDSNSDPKFDINNIPASTIVFSQVVAAPILSNTVLTTPTLPASSYYGLMIGKSVLGNLSDVVPMTAEILNSSLVSDSSACGSNAPYTMTFP
jgi:hypothetical protein